MVDETLDRLYLESRGELNRAIDSGFRTLGTTMLAGFKTLHRIQWTAPWASVEREKCN